MNNHHLISIIHLYVTCRHRYGIMHNSQTRVMFNNMTAVIIQSVNKLWVCSHVSTGMFQRCLLLPPPKNEIWPFLQHTSCKLRLIDVCVCVCVQPSLRCALHIYSAVKRCFIYFAYLSHLKIVWWSESCKYDKYAKKKSRSGKIFHSIVFGYCRLQCCVFICIL